MAARAVLKPNVKSVWLGKSETWPIIACMGLATGWCGYMSMRHVFTSPDVSWERSRRGSPLKDNEKEAETWWWASRHHVAKDPSKIRIFSGFEKKYV